MSDEFFREVDEEYRRDKVSQFWKKYNALIIGIIAVVVIGVGGYRYWENHQLSKARESSATYMAANALILEGKGSEGESLLAALAKDAPAGYALLAKFRLAGEIASRDGEAGIREYNALAADSAIASEWRDLAKLRSAMLRMDIGDGSSAQSDLELLAGANAPWRHTAREMLGLLFLKRGDYAGAGRWFDAIAQDAETPADLRRRLELYSAVVAGGAVTTAN
jgi:Uncharacterized protein conserved in bacteria